LVLNQGRIERILLDAMKEHGALNPDPPFAQMRIVATKSWDDPGDLEVERSIRPTRLDIDSAAVDDFDAYPVTVDLYHMPRTEAHSETDGLYRSNLFKDDELDAEPKFSNEPGSVETLHAKYVVGCDGARSWTRK
jgi:phenol 2-monooxygenase